jgi:type I restriction enzyme S subunit
MKWKKIKLREVLSHRKGFIEIDDETEYKLVTVKLHRKGVFLREQLKGFQIKTKKQQVCKAGDFIVAEMDAKVGGYGFIPDYLDGAIVSSHYFLFEVNEEKLRPKFLEVVSQLKIIQDQIKAVGSTNYAAIRPYNVLDWEIPLPPIEKQIEIENLYLKVKQKVDNLNVEFEKQLTLLDQLNQAILQEAVQGKLVPQDLNDEPASELLKRIKAEKMNGSDPSGRRKKEKPLPPIKPEEIPYEIPENWVWCRLDDIIDFRKESLRRGPFGSSITKSMFIPENSPNATKIFEQKNAIYKDYRLGNYFIDIVKHPNLKSFLASGGDIIISCAGTIGEAYLLPNESPVGIINQALLKIRLNEEVINNSYFIDFFKAIVKSKVNSDAKGSAMKNLGSIKYLRESLLIPLPPLSEQKRIVAEIERQLAKTKQLKEHILANQAATEQLLKALLHQAFEVKENEENLAKA